MFEEADSHTEKNGGVRRKHRPRLSRGVRMYKDNGKLLQQVRHVRMFGTESH